MAVQRILERSPIDFPNLDFAVERSGYQIVVFGMKIYFCDRLAMGIIVLNEPFASQIVQFYLFVSGTGR